MGALLLLLLALTLRGDAQETTSWIDEHRTIPVDYDSGMPLVPPSFPVSFKAEVEQRWGKGLLFLFYFTFFGGVGGDGGGRQTGTL